MTKIEECVVCKKLKEIYAKNKCRSCYMVAWARTRKEKTKKEQE